MSATNSKSINQSVHISPINLPMNQNKGINELCIIITDVPVATTSSKLINQSVKISPINLSMNQNKGINKLSIIVTDVN